MFSSERQSAASLIKSFEIDATTTIDIIVIDYRPSERRHYEPLAAVGMHSEP